LTSPADATTFTPGERIAVSASAETSDGAIARVDFYANNQRIGTSTTEPFGMTWSTPTPGIYTLKAVAFDSKGFSPVSDPVRIRVGTGADIPVAEISNLSDGQIIREGTFDLFGTADNHGTG